MSGKASMAIAGPTASTVNGTSSNGALTSSHEEEEDILTDHYGFQYAAGEAHLH